jgi:hypothetical protein
MTSKNREILANEKQQTHGSEIKKKQNKTENKK